MLRSDYTVVPAGPLLRMVPRGREAIDEKAWAVPLEPAEVRARYRRARGQDIETLPDGRKVTVPQPYERRLFIALVRARRQLGEWYFLREDAARAASAYESIVRADPETLNLPEVAYPLGMCLAALGRRDDAQGVLIRALRMPLDPPARALALGALADIRRAGGDVSGADRLLQEALRQPGLPGPVREKLERRGAPR